MRSRPTHWRSYAAPLVLNSAMRRNPVPAAGTVIGIHHGTSRARFRSAWRSPQVVAIAGLLHARHVPSQHLARSTQLSTFEPAAMRATLHRLQAQLADMDPSWLISICATDHRLRIFAPLLLERCGEVTSSLAELLAIPLAESQRRLVICDDSLSDGGAVELVEQLRQRYGRDRCRVLIVVDPAISQQRLEQLWRCGPDGLCCLEHCGNGEGMQAILSALQGIACCDHDLQRRLQQPYRPCSGRPGADQLSTRDLALIQAVARGHTSRQIGALLQLRSDTVRRRLSALYRRLQVRDQRGLIAWALQQGVLHSCDLLSS